jgi:ferredoxin/flavodoxin---NADP+ reductase
VTVGLRVAVVGSGPSGAFVAQELGDVIAVDPAQVTVDVYEQLPVPYGLVRYGVAPDHQKIKAFTGSLAEIFARPNVRFIGNVRLGAEVSLAELRRHYDAVVIAGGAGGDRQLGIPGEDLAGVCSATDFVAWYSGHPDTAVDRFALTAKRAMVIGLGNVALDVARMLCRTPDELSRTDVPQHVLDVLAASTIEQITVVGRRGAEDAKFSNKELGELRGLSDTTILVDPSELPADDTDLAPLVRRMVAVLRGYVDEPVRGRRRTLRFAFSRAPIEIVGPDVAAGLRVRRSGDGGSGDVELIPAEFVVRSVGSRGLAVADLPFDPTTGTVPNEAGRVLDGTRPVRGTYVAGWIKRGPSGVIGTNRRCAAETVASMLADQADADPPRRSSDEPLPDLVAARHPEVVTWPGWELIDAAERSEGQPTGRARVKLHQRERLIAISTGRG